MPDVYESKKAKGARYPKMDQIDEMNVHLSQYNLDLCRDVLAGMRTLGTANAYAAMSKLVGQAQQLYYENNRLIEKTSELHAENVRLKLELAQIRCVEDKAATGA